MMFVLDIKMYEFILLKKMMLRISIYVGVYIPLLLQCKGIRL